VPRIFLSPFQSMKSVGGIFQSKPDANFETLPDPLSPVPLPPIPVETNAPPAPPGKPGNPPK